MADKSETTPGDEPPAEEPSKKYDQAFFLDLAAKGTEAWNAWRRGPASKDVRVTFAGTDFSEALDKINFQSFEFGDHANFSECKWRGGNREEIQKDPGNFTPGRANFTAATFGDKARFTNAAFGYGASFRTARFGDNATFEVATFGDDASFEVATFRNNADFQRATFGDGATFDGAAFGKSASFKNAVFNGHIGFSKKSGDYRFLSISFANARFKGEADFAGRTFEAHADFTNARFYYPPDFDAVTKADRIDFTGANIAFVPPGKCPWTKDSNVPVRLRAFRKVAEETKNHDLERDLYIEERKAERGIYLYQLLGLDELKKNLEDIDKQQKHVWLEWRLQRRACNAHWLGILAKPGRFARLLAHLLWIAVMFGYWALADYGRSFARPVAWLGASLRFFYLRYHEVLAPLMPKAGPLAAKYEHAVGMVALGNAVPFVGPLTIDANVKEFLFCPDKAASCLPPEGYQRLVLGQNVLSIILVFFIGLALRNYFKIK